MQHSYPIGAARFSQPRAAIAFFEGASGPGRAQRQAGPALLGLLAVDPDKYFEKISFMAEGDDVLPGSGCLPRGKSAPPGGTPVCRGSWQWQGE
jgi:hypothetical protein